MTSDQTTYEVGGRVSGSRKPRDIAKERVAHTSEVISEELINEISEECMNEGQYISTAKIEITSEHRVTYSDPLKFFGVETSFAHDSGGFELLFEIARDLNSSTIENVSKQ